ncbi:MAG: hypothetical protein SNJ70_03065 [Armatimonadota bacterium]
MQKNDLTAKIIGLLVFFAGIALLIFVFHLSYNYYSASHLLAVTNENGNEASPVSQLGNSAISMFSKIGLLFVMAVVGSLIASRGIHLYFYSCDKRKDIKE